MLNAAKAFIIFQDNDYKARVLNFSWQVVCENLPANFLFYDFGIYIGLVFNVKHKVDY
ncbi:hypothetical protein M2273_005162 [Mucilaginibacter lappiensis]